jgi:DNA polymerase-3 subunit delta'
MDLLSAPLPQGGLMDLLSAPPPQGGLMDLLTTPLPQGGLMDLLSAPPPQGGQAGQTPFLSLALPGLEAPAPVRPTDPDSAEHDSAPLPLDDVSQDAGFAGLSAPDSDAARAAAPCLDCPECIRMLTHLHRDCFFFDGLAGSIKIDEVRAMRAVLGEPAREARCRVVILREAQSLVEAAANALLKSLEEPRPGTSFVLLAPQRERLLPTLISRSLVLTLPWPWEDDPERRDRLALWEAALCSFIRSGRDLFERSGVKGAVDAALVHDLAGLCRRALAGRIRALQTGDPPDQGLESLLARLPAQGLRILDEALAECQDSLIYNVNPTLVLEWLATRMHLLLPRPAA